MVLVMDTATYRYPQTWVPLDRLYDAMGTKDSGADRMRSYVEVQGIAPDRRRRLSMALSRPLK